MSDRSPYRLAKPYRCEQCGKTFHPWIGSARRFCTVKCAGQAKSDAATTRNHARIGPVTEEFAAAFQAEATGALMQLESQLAGIEADLVRVLRSEAGT